MSVIIGPAGAADAGEIFTLQRAAWVSEAQANDTTDIPPLTESLAQLCADLATHHVLVARDGHRLIGTVRAHADGTHWHIGRLGVVPDRVGTGLGTRLLAAIEAAAPDCTDTFALFTGPRSGHNLAFYARRGYVRTASDDGLAHFTKPRGTGVGDSGQDARVVDSVTGLDHVGLAVNDIDAAIRFWGEVFDAECVLRETNTDQRVHEAMLSFAGGPARIQLLAAAAEESTIARFLDRHGPGVQQLALTVTDVEAAAARLRGHGLRVLYDEPRPGTAGSRVNFVHPKDTGGVLVELVEPAADA